MMGHTLGAAGGLEAIVCAQVLRHGEIPPTKNLENPALDDGCDLNYCPGEKVCLLLSALCSICRWCGWVMLFNAVGVFCANCTVFCSFFAAWYWCIPVSSIRSLIVCHLGTDCCRGGFWRSPNFQPCALHDTRSM